MVKEEIKIGNVKVLVNDEYVEDEVEKVLEEVGKYVEMHWEIHNKWLSKTVIFWYNKRIVIVCGNKDIEEINFRKHLEKLFKKVKELKFLNLRKMKNNWKVI